MRHWHSRYDSQDSIFQGYVELVIHPLRQDLKRVKINSKQCRILFFIMPYRFFIPKKNESVSLKQWLLALYTFKAQNGRVQVNFGSFCKIALLVTVDIYYPYCNGQQVFNWLWLFYACIIFFISPEWYSYWYFNYKVYQICKLKVFIKEWSLAAIVKMNIHVTVK